MIYKNERSRLLSENLAGLSYFVQEPLIYWLATLINTLPERTISSFRALKSTDLGILFNSKHVDQLF